MNPITRSSETFAEIHKGVIVDVDMSTYSVSIETLHSKKPQTGICFATPYQNAFGNGEGIYFMPEVGGLCWVCFPSDGHRPFVLAWAPFSDEGNYASGKRDLNPGDIFLGTWDENFLILRRGGVVQIGGGPLSQRMYMPLTNTIKDFCENYHLQSLAGELEWGVGRAEETTEGDLPARLKISVKETTSDKEPIAFLEMGSHEQEDGTMLSLTVKESGLVNAYETIRLSFNKNGDVIWDVEGSVFWNVFGEFNLFTDKDINIKTEKQLKLDAKTTANLKSVNGTTVESTMGTVDLKGTLTNVDNLLIVDNGTQPVALAIPLLTWLASHTHMSVAPGTPTGPALPPPTPSITSKSIFGT